MTPDLDRLDRLDADELLDLGVAVHDAKALHDVECGCAKTECPSVALLDDLEEEVRWQLAGRAYSRISAMVEAARIEQGEADA